MWAPDAPGVTPFDEDGLVSYRVPDLEGFLTWLVTRDFLLHGSPVAIQDGLEPRIAHDTRRGIADRAAVYLTDIPVLAMFCGLVHKAPGALRLGDIARHRDNDEITYQRVRFLVGNADQICQNGYVYVVSKEVAEAEEEGDFLSFRRLEPELVVRVERPDLRYDIEVEP